MNNSLIVGTLLLALIAQPAESASKFRYSLCTFMLLSTGISLGFGAMKYNQLKEKAAQKHARNNALVMDLAEEVKTRIKKGEAIDFSVMGPGAMVGWPPDGEDLQMIPKWPADKDGAPIDAYGQKLQYRQIKVKIHRRDVEEAFLVLSAGKDRLFLTADDVGWGSPLARVYRRTNVHLMFFIEPGDDLSEIVLVK